MDQTKLLVPNYVGIIYIRPAQQHTELMIHRSFFKCRKYCRSPTLCGLLFQNFLRTKWNEIDFCGQAANSRWSIWPIRFLSCAVVR